jgi:mycobactin lysine-N-oxygenase
LNDEASVKRALDAALALERLTPRIHVPALAGLVHGPGFANLSCLGRLSDHVLSAYLQDPLPDKAQPEMCAVFSDSADRADNPAVL